MHFAWRRRFVGLSFLTLALAWMATPGWAGAPEPIDSAAVPPATGSRPIVRIGEPGQLKRLYLSEVEAVGLYRVETDSFWEGDTGVFEGVLVRDLLAELGLEDTARLDISAFDDYRAEIPAEDWTRWPLMLATRRDGRPLSRRDKGPTRIIYPRSMSEELKEMKYRNRWVWWIDRIVAHPE